ncbi:MAG: nickel/cobalt transporter [Pseudonocardiaceae bacterium]
MSARGLRRGDLRRGDLRGGGLGAVGRWVRRLAVIAGLGAALAALATPPAGAHPLGNFTVNHYNSLTVHADRVELHAVVDSAEIPTRQELGLVDTGGDGAVSPLEGEAYAVDQCDQLNRSVAAEVDGAPLRFAVRAAQVRYPPGEGGLPTTRLVCELTAPADLGAVATLSFRDTFRNDRIGWREITAIGVGVGLPSSPVPARSVSDELRSYPGDLLTDPLDVREVTLRIDPDAPSSSSPDAAASAPGVSAAGVPTAGVLDRIVGASAERFTELAGPSRLTPLVGVLAVLLALVLGASHAALPGHGKTLMAAYLVGRRGTVRDALLIGATVTLTHTAGVLLLGLTLSVFSTLAGEGVLAWLGILSGLLVTGIGAVLLRSALRERRAARSALDQHERIPALAGAPASDHGHRHGHGHDHEHGHGHGHGHGPPDRLGRGSLVGIGVVGGLVPSPSALVVLLSAIALGRSWFGVLLVLAYGLGMAATLTAAGLLLVHLRDRMARLTLSPEWQRRRRRLDAITPVLTALLVIAVGVGLATRALMLSG